MPAPSVAVVTGAARGMGRATVDGLTAEGWSVVAVDVATGEPALPYRLADPAELEAACADAPGPGVAVAHPADVRDVDGLAAAVEAAEQRFGGLDAAIACAGVIAGGSRLWQVPADQERALLEINLGGVLNLARVAVPAMLRRPEPRNGRFIAVASAGASKGLPKLAAYCASKAGIVAAVRALAIELTGRGVTANTVSPGSTGTAMLDESARLYGLEGAQDFAQQQPIRRLLDPAEIARALVFLASPDSGGITGADLAVDGGLAL